MCFLEYRRTSVDSTIFMSVEVVSGLTDTAINEIVKSLPYINSPEYIENHISIVDSSVQEEVL